MSRSSCVVLGAGSAQLPEKVVSMGNGSGCLADARNALSKVGIYKLRFYGQRSLQLYTLAHVNMRQLHLSFSARKGLK